jgi:replication-associated recombination protein RarA
MISFNNQKLLADRMRPNSLDEFLGQEELKNKKYLKEKK